MFAKRLPNGRGISARVTASHSACVQKRIRMESCGWFGSRWPASSWLSCSTQARRLDRIPTTICRLRIKILMLWLLPGLRASVPARFRSRCASLSCAILLLADAIGVDPWGNEYELEESESGVGSIFSAGPDGEYQTEDDLRVELAPLR